MEPGQVAYEAYRTVCGGKSVHGEDLPGWNSLLPEIREYWRASADAVRMFLEGHPGAGKPRRLHGRSLEVHDVLVTSGIIHPEEHVRRVIIDIDVAQAVTCYIERYPDSRVLELLPALGGGRAEIRWADKVPETVAEAEQI